jgi:hypothetical protein
MIIIDDNFCDRDDVVAIHDFFVGTNAQFLWQFGAATNIAGRKEVLNNDYVVEQFQMANSITYESPIFQTVFKIFKSFLEKHNIPFYGIIRIKANLLTRGKGEGYHLPHVDSNVDHKVFLYYVNDSDGDTFMFDKMFDNEIDVNPNKFNVIDRISPAMGKAVVFDGRQYHASSSPLNSDYRCIINIDFFDYDQKK